MGLYEFKALLNDAYHRKMLDVDEVFLVLEAESEDDARKQAVDLLKQNDHRVKHIRVNPVKLPYSYILRNQYGCSHYLKLS